MVLAERRNYDRQGLGDLARSVFRFFGFSNRNRNAKPTTENRGHERKRMKDLAQKGGNVHE
jgi:hypothetical protein